MGFVRGCDGVGKSRQEGRQAVGMQSSIVETPLVSCCVIFLSETMQLCMSTACSKRHIGMFVPRYQGVLDNDSLVAKSSVMPLRSELWLPFTFAFSAYA